MTEEEFKVGDEVFFTVEPRTYACQVKKVDFVEVLEDGRLKYVRLYRIQDEAGKERSVYGKDMQIGLSAPRFQERVAPWMQECFGPEVSEDTSERNFRFLEEALELVQSCVCSEKEAHELVAYVYGRAPGVPTQEVGGVMVTLAALCLAQGMDMHDCGEVELERILDPIVMDRIRQKQATKPQRSPLPGSG